MATVGEMLVYNVTARDEDGDVLTFSLINPLAGMYIDPSTGLFTWTPLPSDVGDQRVSVQVSDGKGGTDAQLFPVRVAANNRPGCTITSPQPGSTVKGTIRINGTASRASLPIVKVQVRIDGGRWMDAEGTDAWGLELDTGTLSNGRHTIEARAYDGSLYSETCSREFLVSNPGPELAMEGPEWCLIMVVTSIIVLASGLVLWYARRGDRPARERDRPVQGRGRERGPPR
jgi:hypothetical protein